jgi:hypothetical protein
VCSQLSCHNFRVSFVQCSGEMKYKTPREKGHSSSFSREEDEQSTPKQHRFGKVHFSPLIFNFSQLHP